MSDLRGGSEFEDGERAVTLVTATVGEHQIDGALVERHDAEGRLVELTLLLRPLAGLVAAVQQMGERLAAQPLPSSE